MKANYGETVARDVSGRIASPCASATVIAAIPAANRVDGMIAIDLSTNKLWVFDAEGASGTSASTLAPAAGTGCWTLLVGEGSRTCRAVSTVLAAYANVAGVWTATANGALAAQDGVTMVAGDMLFVQEGIANVTAADAGPWIVTSLGAAGAKVVLTRPGWWLTGALIPQAATIKIGGEGTLFGGSTFKSFVTTALKVVDTDAPVFWPDRTSKTVTLSSGTLAAVVTTMPVRSSAGLSAITITSLPSTIPHANTRVWRVSALTAGVSATASIQIVAETAPGTTNASDLGVYALTVTNW